MSAPSLDIETLLRRHAPLLRYDSQETYFADSAATWTDNTSNVLRGGAEGRVIATAAPGASGVPQLSLDFLGPTYATGTRAGEDDVLSDTTKDYAAQARALHQQPGYANVVYARAKVDSTDRLWLQYWYWYFYNEANLTAGFGRHEGDWEMVQLRLDGATPDLAVYAQHAYADWRRWSQVETASGSGDATPVVYIALGSHAAYFAPGTHPTVKPLADRADGLRESPASGVVVVSDPPPRWLQWPGRWGDTRAHGLLGDLKLFSNSPTAPCRHAQWRDPLSLQRAAEERRREPVPPHPALAPAPQVVGVRREDGSLAVDVRLSRMAPGVAQPEALMVTANSPDDRVPPRTARIELHGAREGTFQVPIELTPGQGYEIHVSAMPSHGVPSAAVPADVPAGARSAA